MSTRNSPNIAALQAISPRAGDQAIVAGYYAGGDLGGGTFYWEPLSVTAATNAAPIAITTSVSHGYTTGQLVLIAGVAGNTAANGTWTVTITSPTSFTLNGSAGNGA